MGFLPIVLIVVYLLNNKGGLKDFLGGIDFESLSPILSLFGADNKTIELLSSPEIKQILSGNADIKTLIPLISTFISSMNKVGESFDLKSQENQYTAEYLNPIKDVASDEILSSLGNYFNS